MWDCIILGNHVICNNIGESCNNCTTWNKQTTKESYFLSTLGMKNEKTKDQQG